MSQTTYNVQHTAAVAGLPVGNCDFASYFNEEASAGLAFGSVVRQGTADDGALELDTLTQAALTGVGVVVRDHFDPNQLTSGGLVAPDSRFRVVRRGQIWMLAEEAITILDPVFVRCTGMAGDEVAGDVRDDIDTDGCDDCSHFARFVTSVGAAGLVLVEWDFTSRLGT